MQELWKAALATPRNKAFGADGVSGAALRIGSVLTSLLDIVNKYFEDPTSIPTAWLHSIIVAIPKKGNAKTLDQHRGISLMSVVAKLVNKVLLWRIAPVNSALLPWQSGFRPKRSTTEQICALRILIDRCVLRQKSAVIVFIDFSKAFDSVDRAALRQIVNLYGIPEKLSKAVDALYCGTTAVVRTPDGISDPFPTTSGILQGDTLAPFLFVLAMDFVMRHAIFPHVSDSLTVAPRRSSRFPAVHLQALAYADDIALLADNLDIAARMLQRMQDEAAAIGLQVNLMKTEFMTLGIPPDVTIPEAMQHIKRCERFTYLGTEMSSSHEAFLARRRLAWVAARKLHQLFTSAAPDDVRLLFYRAAVEPVFLYGAESWVMDSALSEEVDCGQRSLLRYSLNIRWPNVISNVDLLRRSRIPSASNQLHRRRLLLLGKAFRSATEGSLASPLALVLQTPSTGAYRPHKSHKRDLREIMMQDVECLGLTWSEAQKKAINSETWEALVEKSSL
jgi:hypothetical protein